MTRSFAFLFIGLFLCVSSGFCQEVPELDRLETLYEEQIEKVTDPIRESYRKALVRLQDSYTKEANLDAALAVRKEIERIDAELASGSAAPLPPLGAKEEMPEETESPSSTLRDWKGDGQADDDDGDPILRVKASTSMKAIENSFDVDEFEDGMLLKFEYRSSDYSGTGIQLKGYNTPTGHYRHTIPIDADGRWKEVEWVFETSKYLDARKIRFVIEILAGGGEIEFKEIVVEEL